jgi:diacylglycerol kinase family enzyme
MTRTVRRVVLCANPSAQSGKARERIGCVKQRLEASGLDVEVLETEPAGRTPKKVAARLVQAAASGAPVDVAVAMGGDGTFREVAIGILDGAASCALGLIPAGTANDQAKSLGIPVGLDGERLERALDILVGGHELLLDVGEVQVLDDAGAVLHDELFFDSVGFGFQAEVLHQRNEDRSAVQQVPLLRDVYRDHAVYAGALLDAYVRSFVVPTKMTAIVDADGARVVLDDILDLVVKNTAIYGGAWVLAREGLPDDGKMEVVPFVNRRELFSKIITDLSSLPDLDETLHALGVEHSRAFGASHMDITLRREGKPEVRAQLDGEEWISGHRFRVNVRKNLLPVVVPAGFEPPWRKRP